MSVHKSTIKLILSEESLVHASALVNRDTASQGSGHLLCISLLMIAIKAKQAANTVL